MKLMSLALALQTIVRSLIAVLGWEFRYLGRAVQSFNQQAIFLVSLEQFLTSSNLHFFKEKQFFPPNSRVI